MSELVIGGQGFLGHSIINNMSTISGQLFSGVREVKDSSQEVRIDLTDAKSVYDCLEKTNPKLIINTAGVFSSDFQENIDVNLIGTHNLLMAVKELKLDTRILLIGSAAEYGRPDIQDGLKETAALEPISPYGLSKKAQLDLMKYFVDSHGLNIVMARVFNIYAHVGEPACSTRLMPGNLQDQATKFLATELKEIKLGYLEEKRDFIHIVQAASDILAVALHGETGDVYNIGSGVPTKVRDFVEDFLKKNSIPTSTLVYSREKPKNELPLIFANIDKVTKLKEERSN
jgi:nucleoside-diphosphate-sugar epimerase